MTKTLSDLYQIAKDHKDNHKSCGGEPYKSYEKLYEIVHEFSKQIPQAKEVRILEIGTAVGFTTYILQSAFLPNFSKLVLDTIEFHQEHIDEAKKNLEKWNIENCTGNENFEINFFVGDAKDILPKLETNHYDIIFFDGYGVKLDFYNDFERILKPGRFLITANSHLRSTEQTFFEKLKDENHWQFIEAFADTTIHKKCS